MNTYLYVCEVFAEFFGCDEDSFEKDDLISSYIRDDDELEEIKQELEYRFEIEISLDYDNLGTIEELVKQIDEIIEEECDV